MKKLIYSAFILIISLAVFISCEKEPKLTVLGNVDFPPAVNSNVTSVTLKATDSTSTASVMNLSWSAADYGIPTHVTYTVLFDVPGDTIGDNPWSNAVKVVAGVDVLTKSFTTKQLNNAAISLGLTADATNTMVICVQAFADRPALTHGITLSIKPYKPYVPPAFDFLYLAGDFQGWSIGTAVPIASAKGAKKYEGYINIPAGGTMEYKSYTILGNWNSDSYGDKGTGASGTLTRFNAAGHNFKAPEAGYYEICISLNDSTWKQVKTTWSIIGDAADGWSTDIPMTYDPANKVWKVTKDLKTSGSFKFRANNAWTIDFGIDDRGNLGYADNPFLGSNTAFHNITVPSDGNYTITLDLSNAGTYSYKAVKNP